MKNWEELTYSNTFGELVDKFNKNSQNSSFMDKTTGKILCNSMMYNGRETIDDELVLPFKNIKSSGLVNSDTIFNNFVLYFRDENKVIELNNFPIDLLSFNDNKLHFLFIKSDYTYRISDTIFGRTDELLIGRFIINLNSTWSQFYIMAQMSGTPIYDGADEFYTTDGLIVKSPSDLHLSFTNGHIKRSGINYIDYKSPNVIEYENYFDNNINIPIRYINAYNEIDYSISAGYSIITNSYMTYSIKANLKAKAENLIDKIFDSCYKLEEITNLRAEDLKIAIEDGTFDNDFENRIILDVLNDYFNIFNIELVELKSLLDNQELSIDTTDITTIKTNITNYINTNLYNVQTITLAQVDYLKGLYSFIENRDTTICNNPLYTIINDIIDDLNNLVITPGTISSVATGKYTIQRILFDVYEKCFIIQYGDTVYDTYDEVLAATSLQEYPAPWNKTVYIPLSIIIVKSGITSISSDTETLIISKRGINVDEQQEEPNDFVARLDIMHLEDDLDDFKGDVEDEFEDVNQDISDLQDDVSDLQDYTEDLAKLHLSTYQQELEVMGDPVGSYYEFSHTYQNGWYPISAFYESAFPPITEWYGVQVLGISLTTVANNLAVGKILFLGRSQENIRNASNLTYYILWGKMGGVEPDTPSTPDTPDNPDTPNS